MKKILTKIRDRIFASIYNRFEYSDAKIDALKDKLGEITQISSKIDVLLDMAEKNHNVTSDNALSLKNLQHSVSNEFILSNNLIRKSASCKNICPLFSYPILKHRVSVFVI